jgi:rubrerythrin
MVKKVKSEKPAVVPTTVEELSETIQRKKENAKLLEKQMKQVTAKVLASVDVKQAAKAVQALQAFKQRQNTKSKGLLDSAESQITMSFTMTALPDKPSQRPQLIKIPHPFTCKEDNSRVCLFVKDPARAFKDQIEDLDIPVIAKVIGFDKLKRNFKQYKDKR